MTVEGCCLFHTFRIMMRHVFALFLYNLALEIQTRVANKKNRDADE